MDITQMKQVIELTFSVEELWYIKSQVYDFMWIKNYNKGLTQIEIFCPKLSIPRLLLEIAWNYYDGMRIGCTSVESPCKSSFLDEDLGEN